MRTDRLVLAGGRAAVNGLFYLSGETLTSTAADRLVMSSGFGEGADWYRLPAPHTHSLLSWFIFQYSTFISPYYFRDRSNVSLFLCCHLLYVFCCSCVFVCHLVVDHNSFCIFLTH